MEELTHAFQSLDYFIEWFSVFIAIAGVVICFRGYRVAGVLIALGSGMHALGYYLAMEREPASLSQLDILLTSIMYPGLLLLTLGVCYLAFSVRPRA